MMKKFRVVIFVFLFITSCSSSYDFDDSIPVIQGLELGSVEVESTSTVAASFQVKNIIQQKICLKEALFDSDQSFYAQLKLVDGNDNEILPKDIGFIQEESWHSVLLEPKEGLEGVLKFSGWKTPSNDWHQPVLAQLLIEGVYCETSDTIFRHPDFLMESTWAEVIFK